MLTREDVFQMSMLYFAYNWNILYDSVYYFAPFEEQITAYTKHTNNFEDITYWFYIIKVAHWLYLHQFVESRETVYDTVMVQYRDANSKVYKNTTLSEILDNTNKKGILNQISQKPCLGITLSTNDSSINLPTNIFKNQVMDNAILDIIAFHVKEYSSEWDLLEVKYIGKQISLTKDELITATLRDVI